MCVLLIQVTQNHTITIIDSTWYHRYNQIILIIGEYPLRLHRMPDCMKEKESRVLTSDGTRITLPSQSIQGLDAGM